MVLPDWFVVYSLAFIGGLILGLLLRFLLTLLVVTTVAVVVGVWIVGLFEPAMLTQVPSLILHFLDGLAIGPQMFLTVGALVFLAGVLGGVLLTSPLRGLERPRAAA